MRAPGTFAALLAAGLLCALHGSAASAAEEEKILNIYNWSDYIGDDTVKDFERETGIKVRYDTFDTNEILHAKLVAGRTGYDVVVPSSYWGKVQADGGLLRKIDKSQLPNYKNLDPVLQAQLARLDPGNNYLVTWLWGYATVGINVDKVKAALGGMPMPANAWDLVFKPAYMSRLKGCGVSFLDAATDVVPAALHYLGKPAYSNEKQDYKDAGALLRTIRPYVTMFNSSGYINDLAGGNLCLVLGFSGDINIARQRAIEDKNGQKIEALIPSTGGILAMDTMAIPEDAPHPGNALKWINYILRPEVAAALTNKVFYANPNKASKPLIRPEIANSPSVYPNEAQMAAMVGSDGLGNSARRLMNRTFTAFKTGF